METREQQIERENTMLRRLRFMADDIAHLIVNTDLPWVDIAIQIEHFREVVHKFYPTKDHLFDWIYMTRFQHLWKDWRQDQSP
jgi:hypothetical protein